MAVAPDAPCHHGLVTPAVPAPVWPPPPQPPAGRRRRRLLYAGVGAWSVLLLAAAGLSAARDEPTVREQRDIARAAPIVDRAVGDLVTAAGPEPVVELGARRLRTGCRVTVLRDGVALDAEVTFRTPAADAPALLDRIAQRLPASYQADVWHRGDGAEHVLWADAGEFVAVRGTVPEPGVVRIAVRTGCRPAARGAEAGRSAPPPSPDVTDDEPVRMLAALGATDPDPVSLTVAPCPGGGAVRTARSSGRGTPTRPPGALLPRPAGTVVIVDTPEVYAYRAGQLSVVAETGDGRTRVAVTASGCA